MFRRLSDLEQSGFAVRTSNTSKFLQEVQALITESFAEIKGEALCDLFVQTRLIVNDPSGLIADVLADLKSEPGSVLQLDIFLSMLAQKGEYPPIFVIGNVGIGKTTLLHYCLDCRLRDEPILPVFIDFLKMNDDPASISAFVVKEVGDALTRRLQSDTDPEIAKDILFFCQPARKIQLENLTRFDAAEGRLAEFRAVERLSEDKKEWNRMRIHYLQEKLGVTVCLVFDNVDHHWTPKFVQSVIAEAMEQARRNECRLVVTLRPYNYGAAYEHGAYAAQPFTVLRQERPDLRRVLERRIEATLKKCDARDFTSHKLDNIFGMTAFDYLGLLKIRLNALLSTPVSDLLAGLAGTNSRRLMLCARTLFNPRTLAASEEQLRSPMSKYDALECLLRPTGSYYESPEMNAEAIIINLFEDESPGQLGNCLIRVRVLQAIVRYGERASHRAVIEDLRRLGYPKERVERVIELFHNFGLVEHGDNSAVMWSLDNTYYCHKLTSCGRYYLEVLMYEYRYALAVKEAMYFPEAEFHKIVGSTVEADRRLAQKIAEINAFDEYISACEREEEPRCEDPALLRSPFYRIAERMKAEHQEAIRRLRAVHDKYVHEGAASREVARQNQQGG
jgi:hypothetical protein